LRTYLLQGLWNELGTLKSILSSRNHAFEIDYSSVLLSSSRVGYGQAATGKTGSYGVMMSARDMLNYIFNNKSGSGGPAGSKSRASSGESSSSSTSLQSKKSTPAAATLSETINIDSVQQTHVLTIIRNSLALEKNMLECEYNRLMSCMDHEVDESVELSSRCSSPRYGNESGHRAQEKGTSSQIADECMHCGSRLSSAASSYANSPRPTSAQSLASAATSLESLSVSDIMTASVDESSHARLHSGGGNGTNVCHKCRANRLLNGRLPRQQLQHQQQARTDPKTTLPPSHARKKFNSDSGNSKDRDSDMDDDGSVDSKSVDSINTPTSHTPTQMQSPRSSSSRMTGLGAFRSKIRAAMDEHHFFDDIN
jgi:hypothetical protein